MDDHKQVYDALKAAADEGRACALATVISTQGSMPRQAGAKMLIFTDGATVGTVGGGAMESLVIKAGMAVMNERKPRLETYTLNSLDDGDPGVCGGTAQIFVEPVVVPLSLIVIGGGHVGKALAQLGLWMGWRVTLCDDRPEYASPAHVPGLHRYVVCAPAEITAHIEIDANSWVCAVTRGMPVDLPLLPALLATDAAYIGLIGSRRRWELTKRALMEKFQLTESALDRIHAPIGLELNAETPQEIAVSIVSEMIMLRRGGDGRPMSLREK